MRIIIALMGILLATKAFAYEKLFEVVLPGVTEDIRSLVLWGVRQGDHKARVVEGVLTGPILLEAAGFPSDVREAPRNLKVAMYHGSWRLIDTGRQDIQFTLSTPVTLGNGNPAITITRLAIRANESLGFSMGKLSPRDIAVTLNYPHFEKGSLLTGRDSGLIAEIPYELSTGRLVAGILWLEDRGVERIVFGIANRMAVYAPRSTDQNGCRIEHDLLGSKFEFDLDLMQLLTTKHPGEPNVGLLTRWETDNAGLPQTRQDAVESVWYQTDEAKIQSSEGPCYAFSLIDGQTCVEMSCSSF